MKNSLKSSAVYWRCHRGMLELDTILLSFFDKYYAALSPELKQKFVSLLEYSDPDLFDILVSKSIVVSKGLSDIVRMVIDK